MSHPLTGLRVLDFTRHLPGPYATDVLRRLGAQVIKVEPPDGDPTRWLPPFHHDFGALFNLVNAGKKSVAIDLKSDEGQDFVHRLVKACDIVVESYRPGIAERLRIDAETLRAFNPGLIYCSISGFGAENPRSGHDANFVALAGLLDLQRDARGKPILPATQIGDMGGALFGVVAILAALIERDRTGEGKIIDISMSDAIRAMMPTAEALYRGTNHTPESFFLTGALPCYSVYRTADDKHMLVAALEPHFWKTFCEAIGHPELIELQYDEKARFRVFSTIERTFAEHPRDHWERVFAGIDACVEPVLSIEDAHARFGDPLKRHPLETNFPSAPESIDDVGDSFDLAASLAGFDETEIRKLRRIPAFKGEGKLKQAISRAVMMFKKT